MLCLSILESKKKAQRLKKQVGKGICERHIFLTNYMNCAIYYFLIELETVISFVHVHL